MNLVLDIGNSFVKLALFNGSELVEKSNCLINDLNSYLIKKKFDRGIICTVNHLELSKDFLKEYSELLILNEQLKLPIKNLYKSPKTLGYDRLANAVGAFCLSPDQNNLIIDMGTCLKFDFINQNNEYLGGSISPGLKMRYQSLNTFTAKLPLLEDVKKTELIGTDTSSSISSGVINGMMSEIENMIYMYRKKYAQLNIYLTGGDAQVYISIADTQKSSIFAHDYITLLGLNEILNENVA
jgi:type III pantothenate kinase